MQVDDAVVLLVDGAAVVVVVVAVAIEATVRFLGNVLVGKEPRLVSGVSV